MKQVVTLVCKRDAGYTDLFAVELHSEDKLELDQVPFYLQTKRHFESIVSTDGRVINLNNYYYYEVVSIEEVEE